MVLYDGSIRLAFGYARGAENGPWALGGQMPARQTHRPNPVYGERGADDSVAWIHLAKDRKANLEQLT